MPKDIVNRMADQVANHSSRRRFFRLLGKVAVGAAGLMLGERLTTQPALAEPAAARVLRLAQRALAIQTAVPQAPTNAPTFGTVTRYFRALLVL